MRKLLRTIGKMKIRGTEQEQKEFRVFKAKARDAIMSLDAGVKKKLVALRSHHENTIRHNVMVAHDVRYIAERLGLPQEEIESLFIAALLHDIGKLDILPLILDSSAQDQRYMLEIKRKNHPDDLRLFDPKADRRDLITIRDILDFESRRKRFPRRLVAYFLKKKRIPLNMSLHDYIKVHQERTRMILQELHMDPKIVEFAASHHPEYFEDEHVLDWRCYIITIADKFNAIIQSEGIRRYTTRKTRILALDMIINTLKDAMASSVLAKKQRQIVRVLGEKYIPVEIENFVIPLSEHLLAAISREHNLAPKTLEEAEECIANIEATIDVNSKVEYIVDQQTIQKLELLKAQIEREARIRAA